MIIAERPWGSEIFQLIDEHIGRRLKERREALDMSRPELAGHLSLSEESLAEYEAGELSIPASDLYEVAKTLSVPPGYFCEGLDGRLAAITTDNVTSFRKRIL